MPITVQCPNPACGVISPASDAVNGRTVRCKKCGTPFTAKPTLDGAATDTKSKKNAPATNTNLFPILPAEFGRYRILRLLGRGGMGAVYLAEDSTLGRQVALKMPFFDASESPQRVQRFVREARSAAMLHHPNICTVYDAGEIEARPFITMAYIAGKPLEDEIDPDAPMPQGRAAEIARKIALALDHAHAKGIVHRDLKPANVMLAADGEPVVMDFGLAKQLSLSDANENKLTRDGGVLGTPSYMSPEQVRGESAAVGPATDVYALGVMLFEMLTGNTPYKGPLGVVMLQIQTAPVPPVKEFRPDVDDRLDAVCRKAMAKAPGDRFASMAEFAEALGRYLQAPVASPLPIAAVPAAAVVKAPLAAAPRSPFHGLEGVTPVAPAPKKKAKKRPIAAPPGRLGKWPILIGAGAGVLLASLLVLWAAGVFKVKTADGVLVVQVNEPNAEVFVDGERVTVTWNDGGTKAEIHVKPGTRQVQVRKDGFSADGKELTFKDGDREVFTARLLPDGPPMARADAPSADAKKAGEPRIENAEAAPNTNPSKTYLYDLKEFDLVALDGRLRDGLDDKGIVVKGEKIKKGLEMHPLADRYATVKYKLDGLDATDFEAKVAINDTALDGSASPLTFQVLGDGKTLWTSQPAQAPRQTQDCSVKVEGVRVLELRVVAAGDYRSAVAVWIDPYLLAKKRSTPEKTADDGFRTLFNGKDLTGWTEALGAPAAWTVKDGYIEVGPGKGDLWSKGIFGPDFQLHVEFWLPLIPNARGQGRANSGVFLQGRYEVQILDSFMNDTNPDDCVGALYRLVAPDKSALQKAIRPPEQWQSFDLTFHAPRVDATDKVTVKGRITVVLNGVTIIDDGQFDKASPGGAPDSLKRPGRIRLQEHGAKVRFRNIKIKEL